MKTKYGFENRISGSPASKIDGNRLYSILLDAKESKVSESIYDIADTILKNEGANAKNALEQLWSLKKKFNEESDNGTIDLLIQFYQNKVDIVRNRESHIRKVSKESRGLLEEKRRHDAEIATVKQEKMDCEKSIKKLNEKIGELKVKEQELLLVESQLKKELSVNSNELVNGLYEIILSHEEGPEEFDFEKELNEETGDQNENQPEYDTRPVYIEKEGSDEGIPEQKRDEQLDEVEHDGGEPEGYIRAGKEDFIEKPPYPKSVVKTTKGRILGEYYYNPKVYKKDREYILNSDFFREQLEISIHAIKQSFDKTIYSEAVQMVQDTSKRINESQKIHAEKSVNEILNEENLKEINYLLKVRKWDEILRFCRRLKAKIKKMGGNYYAILKEQMESLSS